VYGVKRAEGRSWPTDHRGRLWIAAGSKKATDEEISAVVSEHLVTNPDAATENLPPTYPLSVLLGCVEVTDCLTQEQYRASLGSQAAQSDSPFVFICTKPQLLATPIPISGQHKIWSLEPAMWRRARQLLLPSQE